MDNEQWIKSIKVEELCEQHQDFVRCIGWEDTLKLIKAFGKTVLYFSKIKPNKPFNEDYQRIAQLVGLENTLKLEKTFRGEWVHLNGLDEVIREKKHEYIIKNFKGNNQRALALITGMSEQWVYEIIKKDRRKKYQARQLGLF